jgi:chromosome segregation and condensation protein ScpB
MNKIVEPLATRAMADLIELTLLAQNESVAADALKECFELGMAVLVIDIERDAAEHAGKAIVHFKLNETLMVHLAALRAEQRKYRYG